MSKAREWFLNPVVGYKCEVNENGIGLSGNEIHVVEYDAFREVVAALRKLINTVPYNSIEPDYLIKARETLRKWGLE